MARRWGLALACLLVIGGVAAPPPARAANGIVINSSAVYDVRPSEGVAIVSVDVAATNVTPDTATGRTYYTGISLPIPVAATSVSASAGGFAIPVGLSPADEVAQFADITFGTGVFFQQTYRFTLRFVIEDAGGDPERETWIRGSFVAMPVWAFGSEGAGGVSVEVVLPAGFVVTVPYGDMEIVESADAVRAVATDVDPQSFVAYVSAERSGERLRETVEFEMAGGTESLRFHAWPDDPDWIRRQADILTRGLPLLEEEIGLPYPISGALNVSEHAYQHLGAYAGFFIAGINTIEMRFDADPFTALHEASHVWFNHGLSADRWLIEGFASYYAEVVGTSLGEELVTSELTDEIREAAFPLVAWNDPGTEEVAREDYGYAASHELARQLAELAGPDALQAVWEAAADDELAYGVHPAEEGLRRVPNPDDWRRFLDLFEGASEADFDPLWREWLLTDREAEILPEREDARDAYRATEAAFGAWHMPRSTRSEMEGWDFDDATAELARIDILIADHADMAERAEALSLEPSEEVGDLLGSDGIEEAVEELDRQEQALGSLESTVSRLAQERELIEEIGLIGRADPVDGLNAARAAFEDGDEAATEREADAARALASGAAAEGRLRVAGTGSGILLADLMAMLGLYLRRRRRRRGRAAATA
jgi:hypothetical protein